LKNQKHILFISSWYPNRNNPTHGIFNAYFAKAASLYNRVSVLHVCSDDQIKQDLEIVNETIDGVYTVIVYYKKIKSKLPLYSQLIKSRKFLKAFEAGFDTLISKQGIPQLIQLNVVLPAGIGALHLSKKHHIPYVVNENWSGYTKEDGNYNNPIQKYFTKKIIAGAKKIMPTSTYLQEAMLAHGLLGNYEVVPNVVDVNRFKPLNGTPSQKIKFIHISSLIEKEKNVSGILRAFKMAFSFNPNLELVIVGEGENKINLQKLALELNIADDVIFKGRLTGDELVKTIDECNALLMFSHYETFCLVNIEAFACGKPVITSNAGAIPSYMNERLGIMVEKNDEKKLSEAILKFAKNPSIYNVEYIRSFAQNFSYEKIGKRLNDIYNETLFTSI